VKGRIHKIETASESLYLNVAEIKYIKVIRRKLISSLIIKSTYGDHSIDFCSIKEADDVGKDIADAWQEFLTEQNEQDTKEKQQHTDETERPIDPIMSLG
jgi:hypothetical protein